MSRRKIQLRIFDFLSPKKFHFKEINTSFYNQLFNWPKVFVHWNFDTGDTACSFEKEKWVWLLAVYNFTFLQLLALEPIIFRLFCTWRLIVKCSGFQRVENAKRQVHRRDFPEIFHKETFEFPDKSTFFELSAFCSSSKRRCKKLKPGFVTCLLAMRNQLLIELSTSSDYLLLF